MALRFTPAVAWLVLLAMPFHLLTAVYLDLNGEDAREADWGHALVRVRAALGTTPRFVRIPATSLGDTGAASGAIAICAAVRSHVRAYARAPEILVCSSAETGDVMTACVARPRG